MDQSHNSRRFCSIQDYQEIYTVLLQRNFFVKEVQNAYEISKLLNNPTEKKCCDRPNYSAVLVLQDFSRQDTQQMCEILAKVISVQSHGRTT